MDSALSTELDEDIHRLVSASSPDVNKLEDLAFIFWSALKDANLGVDRDACQTALKGPLADLLIFNVQGAYKQGKYGRLISFTKKG